MIDREIVGQNLVKLIFLGDYQSNGYFPFVERIYGYYLREQFNFEKDWIVDRLKRLEKYDRYPYQKVKNSLKLFNQMADNCYLMLYCQPQILKQTMDKIKEITGFIKDCDQIISKRELIDQSEELLNRLTNFCDRMEIERA